MAAGLHFNGSNDRAAWKEALCHPVARVMEVSYGCRKNGGAECSGRQDSDTPTSKHWMSSNSFAQTLRPFSMTRKNRNGSSLSFRTNDAVHTSADISRFFVFRNCKRKHHNNVQLGQYGRNRTNVWEYSSINSVSKGGDEGNLLASHPTVCQPHSCRNFERLLSAMGCLLHFPETAAGCFLHRRFAGKRLPAPNDRVDIPGIDFHPPAGSSCALRSNDRGAAAKEWIHHKFTASRTIDVGLGILTC